MNSLKVNKSEIITIKKRNRVKEYIKLENGSWLICFDHNLQKPFIYKNSEVNGRLYLEIV